VLTGGTLAWDAAAADWDWERTTALSPRLRGRFDEEPLFVDLRWAHDTDALSLRNARFRGAVLDLAATLHGRPKDELDGEDLRLHRATRRLAAAAICLLVMLTIAAGAGAWIAHRQAQLAEGRRREADRERRIALARSLRPKRRCPDPRAAQLPKACCWRWRRRGVSRPRAPFSRAIRRCGRAPPRRRRGAMCCRITTWSPRPSAPTVPRRHRRP
jgi:hypothetical protein